MCRHNLSSSLHSVFIFTYSISLFIIYISVHLHIQFTHFYSFCLLSIKYSSIYSPIHPFTHLFIHLLTYSSIYLPIHPFTYLFIHLLTFRTDQESLLNVLANIEQTKDDDTLTTSSCDLSTKDEELVQVVKDELLHQLQVLLTNPSQPQLPINQEMETNQYDTSSFETDIDSSVATPLQTPVPTPPRAPTPTQSRADLAMPTPSTVDLIQEDDKSAVQHETPLVRDKSLIIIIIIIKSFSSPLLLPAALVLQSICLKMLLTKTPF